MPRNYYRPRRKGPAPRSTGSSWLGNLIIGIISLSWVAWGGAIVLGILYLLVTSGIPRAYEAVVSWGNDVATTVAEHQWQFTDGVLYGGIVTILVLRYSSFFKTPESLNGGDKL